MVLARRSLLPLLLALPLAAQEATLRQLASFDLRAPRAIAGDVAPDGSRLVVLDDARRVTVIAFDPWRELLRFEVAGDAAPADVRVAADGSCFAVLPVDQGEAPAQYYRLDDGDPVAGEPTLAAVDATPPAGLIDAVGELRFVRSARDHRTAVFRDAASMGLWRDGVWRWQESRWIDDFALTGDGRQLVLARRTGIEVRPVAGGEPWRLPLGLAPDVAMAPFGAGAAFVAVDREQILVADAAARRVSLRLPVPPLGLDWVSVHAVAAADDGSRLAVTARPRGSDEPVTLQIELPSGRVQALPPGRLAVHATEDGWLLLDGRIGPCGVVLEARWTEVAAPGGSRSWSPSSMLPNGVPLPGRGELVYWAPRAGNGDAKPDMELLRCAIADGAVRARQTIGWPAAGPLCVAGRVVTVADDPPRLELRLPDTLQVVATVPLAGKRCELRAAARAPVLALGSGERITVYALSSL